jgi:hypothetical protein
VVHVDALMGGLLFAAVISMILYGRHGFSRNWLLLSALFSGLAILTKAPAVFVLPYFVLVVLFYGWGNWRNKEYLKQRIREFIVWLLVIGIMVVIIWPAILWVPNPEGNVLTLKRDIGRAAITPHHMAQDYRLNSSYYLYTLLTRVTPVVSALAVVGVLGVIWRNASNKKEGWLLVLYIVFFVIMMMLGAKKGDRYILPVFFAVDVMAAAGLWYLVSSISYLVSARTRYRVLSKKYLFSFLSLLVGLSLAGTLYKYHPYTIAYSSPVWPDNLSGELGWGEGLEQVGSWLNINDPDAMVASWYPEELGVYTEAHVAHINAHEQGRVKYVVLYRNMFGRAPDHYANDFIDEYYKKREPVYVVNVVGKEFAWVYEKRVYGDVVGELTSATWVEQAVDVEKTGLAGIELMVATYSGEAKDGKIVVDLIDVKSGKRVQRWKRVVAEIEDKGWTRFSLDESLEETGGYLVVATTEETGAKAPTIRYSREGEYRKSKMRINGEEKNGNMALRLLYLVDGQMAKEEDERLLRY